MLIDRLSASGDHSRYSLNSILESGAGEGYGPLATHVMRYLSLTDLGHLSQVSWAWREAADYRFAEIERDLQKNIVAHERREPTPREWGLTKPVTPDEPALSLYKREYQLAHAKSGTVAQQVSRSTIRHGLQGLFFHLSYEPHGQAALIAARKACIHFSNGKTRDVIPPSGWTFVVRGPRSIPTSGQITDPPVACLIEGSGDRLGVMILGPDGEDAIIRRTPFVSSNHLGVSPHGQFIVSVSRSSAERSVRLYDSGTNTEVQGSVRMDRLHQASVGDDGMISLVGVGNYIQLRRSQNTLIEDFRSVDAAVSDWFPCPHGDFLIKEVNAANYSRRLLVEGIGRQAAWLDYPAGDASVRAETITVSRFRQLVAVMYESGLLAVFSLSDKGKETAPAGMPTGRAIFTHQFSGQFTSRSMTFGNRADVLKIMTRWGSTVSEHTLQLVLPGDPATERGMCSIC